MGWKYVNVCGCLRFRSCFLHPIFFFFFFFFYPSSLALHTTAMVWHAVHLITGQCEAELQLWYNFRHAVLENTFSCISTSTSATSIAAQTQRVAFCCFTIICRGPALKLNVFKVLETRKPSTRVVRSSRISSNFGTIISFYIFLLMNLVVKSGAAAISHLILQLIERRFCLVLIWLALIWLSCHSVFSNLSLFFTHD